MIIGVPERCSGRCSGDAMAAVGGLERCSGHCFALCAERCSGRCSGDAMAAVGGLERCSGHCFALCAERCSGCGRSARRWRSGVASCGLAIGWAGGDYVAGSNMVGFVVRIPLDVYFYVGISKKKNSPMFIPFTHISLDCTVPSLPVPAHLQLGPRARHSPLVATPFPSCVYFGTPRPTSFMHTSTKSS